MLKQLPNALSVARIAAAPVLVALATTGNERAFTWVLIIALLTDIADGLIARAFRLQSQLGALLDSIADILLLFVACHGAWMFHRAEVLAHRAALVLLLGAWILQMVVALLRYRRLSSFHTYLSKVAGYLLGICIGVLFLFGLQPWLLYLAVGVSVLGNLEEIVMVALVPQWRSDVRGLWWVLRERRGGAAR